MAASAVYGMVLGLVFVLMTKFAPQPTSAVIWWSFFAVQLGIGARLCWRRTALPYATAAMTVGSVTSALLAVLASLGRVYPDLPPAWWPVIGTAMVAGPVLLMVESRVNRVRCNQWRAFMQRSSAWDVLWGRHIPDLRRSSESPAER